MRIIPIDYAYTMWGWSKLFNSLSFGIYCDYLHGLGYIIY